MARGLRTVALRAYLFHCSPSYTTSSDVMRSSAISVARLVMVRFSACVQDPFEFGMLKAFSAVGKLRWHNI